MSVVLIDTSLLVDVLRASSSAATYLSDLRATSEPRVHPVVEAELVAGARNRSELRQVSKLLDRFRPMEMHLDDVRVSLRLLQRHRLSDGVSWEDCLLAATAIREGVGVVTLNDKHFRVFSRLRVLRPY